MNGEAESWQNLFLKLAKRFGCKLPPNQFASPTDKEASSVMKLAETPPTAIVPAAALGLEGSVHQGAVEQRIDLMKWSQRDDVKKALASLAERVGLDKPAFEKATWGFLGFVLGRNRSRDLYE